MCLLVETNSISFLEAICAIRSTTWNYHRNHASTRMPMQTFASKMADAQLWPSRYGKAFAILLHRHVSESAIAMLSGARSANTSHHLKFRQNRSNGCGNIDYPKICKTRSNWKTAWVTWSTFKFWDTSISTERLKIQTSNLVCGLMTRRPIQNCTVTPSNRCIIKWFFVFLLLGLFSGTCKCLMPLCPVRHCIVHCTCISSCSEQINVWLIDWYTDPSLLCMIVHRAEMTSTLCWNK